MSLVKQLCDQDCLPDHTQVTSGIQDTVKMHLKGYIQYGQILICALLVIEHIPHEECRHDSAVATTSTLACSKVTVEVWVRD